MNKVRKIILKRLYESNKVRSSQMWHFNDIKAHTGIDLKTIARETDYLQQKGYIEKRLIATPSISAYACRITAQGIDFIESKKIFNLSYIGVKKLGIIVGVILAFIQINTYWKNRILPGRIYLSIWETGKEIPLNRDYLIVPSINPIKANEPVVLRFALTQNNVNSPQITKIFVTFPPEAEVKPILYKGWNWERNNDVEITYYLNYKEISAKGGLYNLPAFEVKFKEVKLLLCKYSIIGNKINPIKRKFVINPKLKYQDFSSVIFHDSTFDNNARTTASGVNVASPSAVEWRFDNTTTNNAVTPDVAVFAPKGAE